MRVEDLRSRFFFLINHARKLRHPSSDRAHARPRLAYTKATMTLRSSFALAALITATAAAQTTTSTPQKQTTRRTPSTASKSTATSAAKATAEPAANPTDNPPNVPPVQGRPKNLYALRYIDTQVGTGEPAKPRQYYTVRYTGWLTDGTKFDSSDDHPGAESFVFPYGARRVIPGWDTGFEGMHVGGKRRLYVPYQLAYGESGRPPVIPAKADLIFDLELVAQSDTPPQEKPEPAPAPQPGETNPAQDAPKPKETPEPSTSKPPTPPPATTPAGQPPQSSPNP
ncbi:peptidylprolyl isomerase [Edaphobacter modestus]|uniref:Peptidyl-prolyl cis-trans isomerase n=2 Tax=Edaphobacter modestus TaxID=388466 RepID=A0A4Q7YYX7_9BACT|nr:peptidylprolyl isomerase [Edaphobacter modestus]